MAASEKILRTCVHCGFCTATCPTYLLLGDELDSPRGRIYLIKDMLENERRAPAEVVRHIDRCLSCLSCMTTCPSGVHYMHLVDHARAYIEATYRRPLADRLMRAMLAWVLPSSAPCFASRCALRGSPGRCAPLFARIPRLLAPGFAAMLALAPAQSAALARPTARRVFGDGRERRGAASRCSPGCAQTVLAPRINAATIRLLDRARRRGRAGARRGLLRRRSCITWGAGRGAAPSPAPISKPGRGKSSDGGLDAIVDHRLGLRHDDQGLWFHVARRPAYAGESRARLGARQGRHRIAGRLGLPAAQPERPRRRLSFRLLAAARPEDHDRAEALLRRGRLRVRDVPEGHICCGSAGTYNILQPEIAAQIAQPQGRAISSASSRTSSPPAISAASRRSRWARRSRSSTPSNCSTGPAAGLSRTGRWREGAHEFQGIWTERPALLQGARFPSDPRMVRREPRNLETQIKAPFGDLVEDLAATFADPACR